MESERILEQAQELLALYMLEECYSHLIQDRSQLNTVLLRFKSPTSVIQNEVFFTQENYKKYSSLPSFVEFLEKHVTLAKGECSESESYQDNIGMQEASLGTEPNDSKAACGSGVEEGRSNRTPACLGAPACLGPEMEFPFVSKISVESQKMFLETFEMIKSGELARVDLQKIKTVQDIKMEVLKEQEEFQKFVYHHAMTNHHLYNFIHPDVWDGFKVEIEEKLKEITGQYSQHYSLHDTIGLAVGAVFKSDAVLTFEQTLLQVGNIPVLNLPENTGILLSESFAPMDAEVKTTTAVRNKVVSEDPIAVSLARKHKVDIVISSSGLSTLLNSQASEYRQQWQLPVTVQRLEENQDQSSSHRAVFIDKPLPQQYVSPRTVNWKFYKRALRRLFCPKNYAENTAESDNMKRSTSSNVKLGDSENRKRRAVEKEEELVELKKFKMADSASHSKDRTLKKESGSSNTNKREKHFVYNLWRFGKLKVLIRCSVDAYRADIDKQNAFTFFSVLPKLEYLPNFGHEKLTPSETARFWLHGYISPQTKLICGRINVFNSELLRFDELFVSDVLQQGTDFNPGRGMKMVFQVFQALKRLPEAKFIFSHKSGEIHGCLYKSVARSTSGSSLKSSFDVHKAKTPALTNYTEAEIPWVAIDCNLFLPWQIRKRRIPCVFPAVTAKELALMARKEQEAKAKKSKKNKKGKKKNKGKANAFAPGTSKQEPTTKQSGIANQVRKSHDRKSQNRKNQGRKFHEQRQHQDRKSMEKERIFASFYDIQPTERESEGFAVAKRASGPISYDDVDF